MIELGIKQSGSDVPSPRPIPALAMLISSRGARDIGHYRIGCGGEYNVMSDTGYRQSDNMRTSVSISQFTRAKT